MTNEGGWQHGQRTVQTEICCCKDCGSTAIRRRGSADGVAYWRCTQCAGRWREPAHVGLGKTCNAKALRLVGLHRPGHGRRLAELRCCEGCGATHVRRTSTVGRIAYWTCLRCGHGWSQVVGPEGAGARVKRPGAHCLSTLNAAAGPAAPVLPMAAAG